MTRPAETGIALEPEEPEHGDQENRALALRNTCIHAATVQLAAGHHNDAASTGQMGSPHDAPPSHRGANARHAPCFWVTMRFLSFTLASLLSTTVAWAESPLLECVAALPPGGVSLPANTPALPILDVDRTGTLAARPSLSSTSATTELEEVRFASASLVSDRVAFAKLPELVAGEPYTAQMSFDCGPGTSGATRMSWTTAVAAPLPVDTGTLSLSAASTLAEPQVELTVSPQLAPFRPAAALVWRVEGVSVYAGQSYVDLRVDLGKGSTTSPEGPLDGIANVACYGTDRREARRVVTMKVQGWLSAELPLAPATLEVEVDCTSQWALHDRTDEGGCSLAAPAGAAGTSGGMWSCLLTLVGIGLLRHGGSARLARKNASRAAP